MNAGYVYLAVDSVMYNLRRLHNCTMVACAKMDFEFEVDSSDLKNLQDTLTLIQSNIEYLLHYTKNDLHKTDERVLNMIHSAVTTSLDELLIDCANEKYDGIYPNIEMCMHFIIKSKQFNTKNYQSHLKINQYDRVSTFVNIANIRVLSQKSKFFKILIARLDYMLRICSKIYFRLCEVEAVETLLSLNNVQ